ncbi:phosphatidate cytidylyltransferase [Sandarakinorhabdus sp.]|uniref:phosphatidate cytidylyltransferase n=1 Tax=Sandarakinorhabdus sp. TaxID=1916663 RepID=UPI00286D9F45|nr:phosphatidate cytidylyltransferase [Sandarakinorhabdus sp.]
MAAEPANSTLLKRIGTALVLLPLAIGAVWVGGIPFAGLAAAAVLVMFTEWTAMHRLGGMIRRTGLAVLAGVVMLTAIGSVSEAMLLLGGGTALLGLFSRRLLPGSGRATIAGLLYCGLPAIALIWLRGQFWGFYATLFVMACVWGADILAYFTGRALGGPKLAPAISPNKTWSGAIGGLVGAALVAGGAALLWPGYANPAGLTRLVPLALALGAVSILGDLFESHLKRRAGVKDSGTLLPGHGGVMDRLDGLVPAAVLGAGVFAVTGWAG